MAAVYLAFDEALQRRVAVKVLKPHFADDEAVRRRFVAEAQSGAALNAPNVVATYDIGHDGAHDFIVMEYVDGGTLADRLRAGPLAEAAALEYAAQMCDALAAAHARGLVHRDVKPANMLVDRDGVLKLGDFGLARAWDAQAATLTQPGMMLGSLPYMSPEQAQGQHVTSASDLYSLGVVLHEMLSGRLPFEGESAMAIALQHVNAAPRIDRAAIAPDVAAVLARLLQKEPRARYGSAAELAGLLRSLPAKRADSITGAQTITAPVPAAPKKRPAFGKLRADVPMIGVYVLVAVVGMFVLSGILAAKNAPAAQPAPASTAPAAPQTVAVPSIAALSLEQARGAIVAAHLQPSTYTRFSAAAPGTVLAQWPAAGAQVKPGSHVAILLSAGPAPRVVIERQ